MAATGFAWRTRFDVGAATLTRAMRTARLALTGWRLAVASGLALAPLGLFLRFILGDELANGDVILAYRPVHAWLAEGLRAGQVPLWTSGILGGFPLAFSEYGWFSPLNWLPLWLLGGHAGFYAAVAGYVALAGLCTYALARTWGLSRHGALLAGLVLALCPFVVGGTPLLNQGAAYWTLPALLWAIHRHFDDHRLAAPLAVVVTALLLLGSHPQLVIIAALPAVLYTAWRVVGRLSSGRSPAAVRRTVVPLALAAGLGAGVSAVRFLPTFALLAASERSGGLSVTASAIGSVNPLALLAGLLLPSLRVPRAVDPQWTAYVSPLILLLAGAALAGAWETRRRVAGDQVTPGVPPLRPGLPNGFLAGMLLTGVLLSLGTYTPLFWLLQRSPLLAYFREPSRFLLWSILALALLAGAGLDRILTTSGTGQCRPGRRYRTLLVLSGMLMAGVAAGHVALRLLQPRILRWGHLQALVAGTSRDYPAEHYLAVFDASWRQTLRATNPLEPGLQVPLLALLGAVWWWGWGRRSLHAGTTALLIVGASLLAYDLVRLPAIPASATQLANRAGDLLARHDVQATPGDASPPDRVLGFLPLAADYEARVRNEAQGRDADAESYRLLAALAAPNLGLGAGYAHLDGYENLMTREQALLVAALGSERSPAGRDLSLQTAGLRDRRRLMGERWNLFVAAGGGVLLTIERLQPLTWPLSLRYDPGYRPAQGEIPAVNRFTVLRPLPRSFVRTEWLAAASPDEALRLLVASGSDGQIPTIVEEGAAADGGLGAAVRRRTASQPSPAAAPPRLGLYEARITRQTESVLEIECQADSDAMLVVLDAFAPGWSATVSGAAVPILRANVAFRAVPIPAGRHTVRFEYSPPQWRTALLVTGVSSVLVVAWLVTSGWSALVTRRRPGEQ